MYLGVVKALSLFGNTGEFIAEVQLNIKNAMKQSNWSYPSIGTSQNILKVLTLFKTFL